VCCSKILRYAVCNSPPWRWPQLLPKHAAHTLFVTYGTCELLHAAVSFAAVRNQLNAWSWSTDNHYHCHLHVPRSAIKGSALSRPSMWHQQITKCRILPSADQLSWHKAASSIQIFASQFLVKWHAFLDQTCPAVHTTRLLRHSVRPLFSDCCSIV